MRCYFGRADPFADLVMRKFLKPKLADRQPFDILKLTKQAMITLLGMAGFDVFNEG